MRRGLAIVRVSKVGDRGEDLISPDLQRAAITTYAAAKGIEVIDWIEALDESGSQKNSPWWSTLDATISRVETERLDCIICWKFSRAARHRLRWAVALDRVEQAGATLESATEGVDTTTSTGRFTRGMLAEMAAFEADRIGEGWKEVKARRVRLGLADGQPRFGYDLTEGSYIPNSWAPALRTLYEWKAAGLSSRSVTFWLNSEGARTRHGNVWQPSNVIRMLDTGFAAGLIRAGGQWLPGEHPAVISEALWQSYLAQRTPVVGRSSASKYPLSGLLLCGYCRRTLHAGHVTGKPPGTLWVCRGVKDRTCRGVMAWAPKITRVLDEWVSDLLAGRDGDYQKALRGRPSRNMIVAQRRLTKIPDELLSIARKNERGFYDDPTYLQLRQDLLDEQRLLSKQTEQPVTLDLHARYAKNRTDALRFVLRHVVVRAERPKYELVPLFTETSRWF